MGGRGRKEVAPGDEEVKEKRSTAAFFKCN